MIFTRRGIHLRLERGGAAVAAPPAKAVNAMYLSLLGTAVLKRALSEIESEFHFRLNKEFYQ
jgi:hypothetical protein